MTLRGRIFVLSPMLRTSLRHLIGRWGLTLMALMLLTGGLFPGLAAAQDAPPAHVDPVTVTKGMADAASLFNYIQSVLGNIHAGRYGDSRELLEMLPQTNISPNMRFLMERGELLNSLNVVFPELSRSLAETYLLVEEGRRPEAGEILQALTLTLEQTRALLLKIRGGMEALETRFGLRSLSPDNPIIKAYDRVYDIIIPDLEALIREYTVAAEVIEDLLETPPGTQLQLSQLPGPEASPYTVSLALNADSRGYSGRPITIDGQVASENGPALALSFFRVLLDTEVVAEFTEASEFQREVTLPPRTPEGQHTLTLEFPAQGLYALARVTRPLEVTLAAVDLSVRSSTFSLYPGNLIVSGTVTSQFGPLKDATVTLRMGGARPTVLQTNDQGAFSGPVALSVVSLLFPGFQRFTVGVDAVEPWHQDFHAEISLFVLNVTNAAFLVLVSFLGVIAVRFFGRARREREEETWEPLAVPRSVEGIVEAPSADVHEALAVRQAGAPGTTRARIAEAYLTAARFLEVTQDVLLLPSATLRDFLAIVGARVGSAFTELTSLTERAVYGSGELADADVGQAEDLAWTVQKEGG